MDIICKRNNKTVYKNGDRVLKVFDESFAKADVLNEALNLARAEQTGLDVPTLQGVEIHEGYWALSYDYIEGKTLAQIIAEDHNNVKKYIEYMIDLQMNVHGHRNPLLINMKEKYIRKILQSDLEASIKYALRSTLEGMPVHNKVCHGDFRPSNVIVRPNGTSCVIDWSHITQGNASADVAMTYLIYVLSGNKEIAKHYLESYCEKSGTNEQYVLKWIPIVAATQCNSAFTEEYKILHDIISANI